MKLPRCFKAILSRSASPRDSDGTDPGHGLDPGILYSSSDDSEMQPKVRNNVLECVSCGQDCLIHLRILPMTFHRVNSVIEVPLMFVELL